MTRSWRLNPGLPLLRSSDQDVSTGRFFDAHPRVCTLRPLGVLPLTSLARLQAVHSAGYSSSSAAVGSRSPALWCETAEPTSPQSLGKPRA